MMKRLLVALLLLACSAANAQFVPGQILTAAQLNNAFANTLPIAGGILTGPLTVPSLSVTGSPIGLASGGTGAGTATTALTNLGGAPLANPNFIGSIKIGSLNALSVGSVIEWPYFGNQGPVFIGPYAGGSYPLTSPAAVGIGSYALYSLNQAYAEVTGVGTWACRFITTGNFDTCLGMNALGAETIGTYMTAVGNDSARNELGGHDFTAVGADSARDGAIIDSVALGSGALWGNSASVTLGGTPTIGDVLSLTFTSSQSDVLNSPQTNSYTVKTGDTLFSIAQGLIAAINASPLIGKETSLQGFLSPVSPAPVVILLDFPGSTTAGWQVAVTKSITGSATETLTIGPGMSASNIVAIGDYAGYGQSAGAIANDVFIGHYVAPNVTTAVEDTCIGDRACFSINSDADNTAIGRYALNLANGTSFNTVIGAYAGANITSGNRNVLVGGQAGNGVTTGTENVVVGSDATSGTAQACITSGAGNIEIGRNICVPSATANGQMSIQNIIYGTGNNGADYTVSTGSIGIGIVSPAVKLDVAGPIRAQGYTVSTLPTGVVGARAYVTDATTCTFAGSLTGGGTTVCPTFYNGTAWIAE